MVFSRKRQWVQGFFNDFNGFFTCFYKLVCLEVCLLHKLLCLFFFFGDSLLFAITKRPA